MGQKNENIDIVITWVDGKDAKHKQKMAPFIVGTETQHDDIAAPTRFTSKGEIYFCVASILRFATFVRKIFIVTDNQNPNLDTFINHNFPNNSVEIEIVDHTVLFKGLEQYLPTFNSLTIETCLYKIPDLSENFIYMNDDFFLTRPTKSTDFFREGKIVAFGKMRSVVFDSFLRIIKPKKNGHKPFGFKDSMLNAAKILDIKSRYFCIEHTPLPLKKSIFENYFAENNEILLHNIQYKFRNKNQFNPQALFYLLALQQGKCWIEKENKLVFIKPANKNEKYIERKINFFKRNKNIIFGCAESIDQTAQNTQNKLFNWIISLLKIEWKTK
jgi:hypothetical protein